MPTIIFVKHDFLKVFISFLFFYRVFWDVPIFMPFFFPDFPEILYFLGFSFFFSQLIVLIFYVLKIKSYFSTLRDIFVSKVFLKKDV
jgi:hypothetical protein